MGNVIICFVIIGIVASIIFKIIKDKKAGKSSCSCGCSSCPMSKTCNKSTSC